MKKIISEFSLSEKNFSANDTFSGNNFALHKKAGKKAARNYQEIF